VWRRRIVCDWQSSRVTGGRFEFVNISSYVTCLSHRIVMGIPNSQGFRHHMRKDKTASISIARWFLEQRRSVRFLSRELTCKSTPLARHDTASARTPVSAVSSSRFFRVRFRPLSTWRQPVHRPNMTRASTIEGALGDKLVTLCLVYTRAYTSSVIKLHETHIVI
jgi:hypothetical protein